MKYSLSFVFNKCIQRTGMCPEIVSYRRLSKSFEEKDVVDRDPYISSTIEQDFNKKAISLRAICHEILVVAHAKEIMKNKNYYK